MYKSQLQELCHRRNWELPEYKTSRDGPAHMPRFTAAVTVNGQVFEAPVECKSTKEAHNMAARLAFKHFTVPPPPEPQVQSLPVTSSASPTVNNQLSETPPCAPVASLPVLQPMVPLPPSLPISPLPSLLPMPPPEFLLPKNADSNKMHSKDTLHLYKNQLQEFAQKKNHGLPVYTTDAEGPPHARRFKSCVSVGGKSYMTMESFTTLREAEQAAAKVACLELLVDVTHEDSGLYKNLLQEFAQRRSLLCPSYETVQSGLPHMPSFSSTIVVGSNTFRGAEAKTKKQAETNAARAAYSALTESHTATKSSRMASTSGTAGAENSIQNSQATTATENHQDATVEETHRQEKRAKDSPQSMNVNDGTCVPGSSLGNVQSENPNRQIHEQPALCSKTVVYPRKSNLPKPESASVLPFTDEEWIAYKVEQDHGPDAHL